MEPTNTVPHRSHSHIILQRLEHTPNTAQWHTREINQGHQPVQPFSPAMRATETPTLLTALICQQVMPQIHKP